MSNFARITLAFDLVGVLDVSRDGQDAGKLFPADPPRRCFDDVRMGIGTSGPRDPDNGIEDIPNWRYWDGRILRASDGKYHLFCSRWPVSVGSLLGCPTRFPSTLPATTSSGLQVLGLTYTYQNGKGHNTTGLIWLTAHTRSSKAQSYPAGSSPRVPGWAV